MQKYVAKDLSLPIISYFSIITCITFFFSLYLHSSLSSRQFTLSGNRSLITWKWNCTMNCSQFIRTYRLNVIFFYFLWIFELKILEFFLSYINSLFAIWKIKIQLWFLLLNLISVDREKQAIREVPWRNREWRSYHSGPPYIIFLWKSYCIVSENA